MNTLKSQCKVSPGTVIEGKWHKNKYVILKQLGEGANGVVYLAKTGNNHVAIKLSDNSISITSEVNVLKSISKVQGISLGPSLIDVDDWEVRKISFYVMEYIKGPNFLNFIQQKGTSWVEVLIIQLLTNIQHFHEKGWIFGDLKPDNLIVTGPPPKIRCIDVGGTTLRGRAIKEYTEFFDRGYWGLGSRKAEPTYDLFAVGMIFLNAYYPNQFRKTTGGLTQLREVIRKNQNLIQYERILINAFEGNYKTAQEMKKDLLERHIRRKKENKQFSVSNYEQKNRTEARAKKRKRRRIETFLLIVVISSLYFIYVLGQLP